MSGGSDDKDKPEDGSEAGSEGWESFAEEASEGSLAPSQELEEALREAADAVDARAAEKVAPKKSGAADANRIALEAVEYARSELEQELNETKDRLLRLQADFENQRKRSLKERQDALQYGHENLVKDLLATLDNLDRAIEHAEQSEGGDVTSLLEGVELVRRELQGTLGNHHVSEIEAAEAVFDPNFHEAMAQAEAPEAEPGTVVQVLQKGYVLRDRLLRPSRVIVAKKPADASDSAEAEASEESEEG